MHKIRVFLCTFEKGVRHVVNTVVIAGPNAEGKLFERFGKSSSALEAEGHLVLR